MTGRRVIIVGLFSAKADHETAVRELDASLRRAGSLVVGSVVQRRGVSRARKPGGAHRMDVPMDAATYIGRGKVEEVAELRRHTEADLVVVLGSPSATQLARLQKAIGCEVISSETSRPRARR